MRFATIVKNNRNQGRQFYFLNKFIEANDVLVFENQCIPHSLSELDKASFMCELAEGTISVTYVSDCPVVSLDKMEATIKALRSTKSVCVNAAVQEPVKVVEEPNWLKAAANKVEQKVQVTIPTPKVEKDDDISEEAKARGFSKGSAQDQLKTITALTKDDADAFSKISEIPAIDISKGFTPQGTPFEPLAAAAPVAESVTSVGKVSRKGKK